MIDQAASVFAQAQSVGIRLDDVTAALIGERFDVREIGERRMLVGKREDVEASRTLLGKATPFVGRDKELAAARGDAAASASTSRSHAPSW